MNPRTNAQIARGRALSHGTAQSPSTARITLTNTGSASGRTNAVAKVRSVRASKGHTQLVDDRTELPQAVQHLVVGIGDAAIPDRVSQALELRSQQAGDGAAPLALLAHAHSRKGRERAHEHERPGTRAHANEARIIRGSNVASATLRELPDEDEQDDVDAERGEDVLVPKTNPTDRAQATTVVRVKEQSRFPDRDECSEEARDDANCARCRRSPYHRTERCRRRTPH